MGCRSGSVTIWPDAAVGLFKASRVRRFPVFFASVGTNIGRCSLAPELKAISFVTDRRPNLLILIAVCIAGPGTFAVAMAVHAAYSQPFEYRILVEDGAISGPSGSPDCDKVGNNGNCCVAFHCVVGIATGSATIGFRLLSSRAVAEAQESFPSRSTGRLERPPKRSFSVPFPNRTAAA